MKSTGEVMGVANIRRGCQVSAGAGAAAAWRQAFLSVKQSDKVRVVRAWPGCHGLRDRGHQPAATINAAGVACGVVNKVTEGRPHIVDMIKNQEISMVINTVEERRNAIADSRQIRTGPAGPGTTYTTTLGLRRRWRA